MTTFALLLAVSTAVSSVPQPTPTLLTKTDINQIVSAVLTHLDVAKYLHPDIPGRLPVKITIADPYSDTRLALVLYHKLVVVVVEAADAVNFEITRTLNGAKVEVSYRPEGMVGTILLGKSRNRWVANSARVYEH